MTITVEGNCLAYSTILLGYDVKSVIHHPPLFSTQPLDHVQPPLFLEFLSDQGVFVSHFLDPRSLEEGASYGFTKLGVKGA